MSRKESIAFGQAIFQIVARYSGSCTVIEMLGTLEAAKHRILWNADAKLGLEEDPSEAWKKGVRPDEGEEPRVG